MYNITQTSCDGCDGTGFTSDGYQCDCICGACGLLKVLCNGCDASSNDDTDYLTDSDNESDWDIISQTSNSEPFWGITINK